MSDTATEEKAKRQNRVQYELEIVDELPPPRRGGGGDSGRSVLQDQIKKVVGNEQYHGKNVRIGTYERATAATAAKNVLQQRHGRSSAVEGFEFKTRRLTDAEDAPMGLFVKYDPAAIVEGAKAQHIAAEEKRLKELEAKRAAKEQEAASGGAASNGSAEGTAKPAASSKSAAKK